MATHGSRKTGANPSTSFPTRINSLVEFEQLFGGAPDVTVDSITLDNDNNVTDVKLTDGFLLYDSIRLYFANGGSKCYIISVGGIPAAATDAKEDDFMAGLAALEKEDEPTPDIVSRRGPARERQTLFAPASRARTVRKAR